MTSEPDISDLVVWLTDAQVSELARLLLVDDEVGATRLLGTLAPGVEWAGGVWRDALLDEARFRELVRPTGADGA